MIPNEDLCANCGGEYGLHNHMNKACPKDINADRNHTEYRRTVFKPKDNRVFDKELISFLTNAEKPFKVDVVRKIIQEYYREEISLSRCAEKFNEIAYYWNKPTTPTVVQGWISIDDRDNPPPKNTDFLVLFDSGYIRRYFEKNQPFDLYTHWMPLPEPVKQ